MAGRPPLKWDDRMLATLRAMRARGASIQECAQELRICYRLCHQQARQLGISRRMNWGRWPGTIAAQRHDRGAGGMANV